MDKVRFAVIGCGSIAEIAHFPSLAAEPAAQLVACCDLNPETAQQAARKWGAAAWYSDYRQMLDERRDLDAAIIATPNNVHRNQAVAVARAGLHVVVEKPLAATNYEAWDIVRVCREEGVKLMVGCDRRFWTHNQWAKQLIDENVIGDVLMARASLHEHWHLYQNNVAHTAFRLDAAVSGGAALTDTGAHAIDLLTWLTGSRVQRTVGIAKRLAMPAEYTLNDDTVWLLLEYENGSYGCVSCNRFSPVVSQATELYGTEGTIFTATDATNPFQSSPMAVYTNRDYSFAELPQILKDYRWPQHFWVEDHVNEHVPKRWMPIMPPRRPGNYERMTTHFVNCILNDAEPLVSGEDGARAVEVMCAVIKSMETDAWVELPLPEGERIAPPHYRPVPYED